MLFEQKVDRRFQKTQQTCCQGTGKGRQKQRSEEGGLVVRQIIPPNSGQHWPQGLFGVGCVGGRVHRAWVERVALQVKR